MRSCSARAARELGRRLYGAPAARRPVVRTPADVAALVGSDMRHLDREHFRVVLLTIRHTVLAVEQVAVGGLDSAAIHPREVFKPAIRWSAAAVILVHNHPSGDPEPSVDDVRMTTRLAEAGQILGVEVLDHVVVGDGRYVSLRGARDVHGIDPGSGWHRFRARRFQVPAGFYAQGGLPRSGTSDFPMEVTP